MKFMEIGNLGSLLCAATAVSAVALMATACSQGTEDSPEVGELTDEQPGAPSKSGIAPEPASYAEGELEGRSNQFRWFRWNKGEPAKVMMPVSTHVCGLTMVRGETAGNTSVMVVRQNGNWVLRGLNPGSNSLQMDAVCEPLSAFRVNAGRTVSVTGDFLINTQATNVTRSTVMPTNSAPVFTGLLGKFEGGGERARVTLGVPPTVEIKVGGQSGQHTATASALSFGLPANRFPRVNSYFLDGFVVSDGTTVHWDPDSDVTCLGSNTCCLPSCQQSVAPLATAFCYLSSVSGDFNGADEWVQVFPDVNRGDWTLGLFANSGNGVTARVSCLDMDQRT
jgi:hypothetical protein